MKKEMKRYFSSKIFTHLFFSYVAVILVFVVIYAIWFISYHQTQYEQTAERTYQQSTAAWGTAMDQQLMLAKSICASVNASENCRLLYQTAHVEGKTVDSMLLYYVQNELRRIRSAGNSMYIGNIVVCFQNDNKLFTPGGVIDFTGTPVMLGSEGRVICLTSVSALLDIKNHSQIIVNKDYFIYAESYTAFNKSAPKGAILVLMNTGGLTDMIEAMLNKANGAALRSGTETLFSLGKMEGRAFTEQSLIDESVSYQFFVPESAFSAPISVSAILPVVMILLLGLMFITVTYFVSKRFYQPIGSIGQMVGDKENAGDELGGIMDGIRSLISERNGYREKMITITPYAHQGMVHMLVDGSAQKGSLSLLTDKEFLELKKPYYMIALVNVTGTAARSGIQRYQDAQALIGQICKDMTTDEQTVVCCPKDVQNMYVIVASDESEGLERLFYTLHERICTELDDAEYVVTLGVSGLEYDLDDLQAACLSADLALGRMLTGGRNSVYFDDTAACSVENGYYFPRDAQKHIVKALGEGRVQDIRNMLDDIYQRNIVDLDLPLNEVRLMLDELHVTVSNALRSVYDQSTTHIQLKRLRENVTVEEIFAYYRSVFETALEDLNETVDIADQSQLEESVCQYIQTHYCDPELSMAALCDHYGISAKVLGVICKKRFGTTFLHYVREKQIRRAADLLCHSNVPLEDVARQCGFVNLLTFRRNFKAVMGMNPSDFRDET